MDIRALADTAAEQIDAYPVITKKDKAKRAIKRRILGQKLAPVDPFSWPNAMLGEGLLAAFEAAGEKKYLQAVVDHLKRWKSAGYRIYYVDNIMNGSLALWIEELLERKAYAFSREEESELLALCREAEEACADWVRSAALTAGGILPYRTHHPDWLFADTLGMVCPFLCRYGTREKDEALLRLGIAQLQHFIEKGMDQRSGLPYHGYDEKSGMKYGIIGWGRACGWMMKGMAESLACLPKEQKEYDSLRIAFERLVNAVLACQRADGGFSWQLEAMEGHKDSSAEGMIGAAILTGIRAGLLRDGEGQKAGTEQEKRCFVPACGSFVRQLEKAAEESVVLGTVKDCSMECRDFAEYPQVYGSYPWGSGSVLAFLAQRENPAKRDPSDEVLAAMMEK